jgi:hypothetical protein
MKGYIKPDKLEVGNCFVCKKPCEFNAYCHNECAIALHTEKERRIQEAKDKSKGL